MSDESLLIGSLSSTSPNTVSSMNAPTPAVLPPAVSAVTRPGKTTKPKSPTASMMILTGDRSIDEELLRQITALDQAYAKGRTSQPTHTETELKQMRVNLTNALEKSISLSKQENPISKFLTPKASYHTRSELKPLISCLFGFEPERWVLTSIRLNKPQPKPDAATSHTPTSSLGSANVLPTELLHMVFSFLDIDSMSQVRNVCRQFRTKADSFQPASNVNKFAPDSIDAVIKLGLGAAYSYQQLSDALFTDKCDTCGCFGAFLFLLDCSRVCYHCFTQEDRYLVLSFEHARHVSAISKRKLEESDALVAHRVTGYYGPSFNPGWGGQHKLVSKSQAMVVGARVHGSAVKRDWVVNDRRARHAARRAANTNLAEYQYSHYHDLKDYNPQRYMSIINYPSVNKTAGTRTVRMGFYCRGCNEWSKKNDLTSVTEPNMKLEESDRKKKCRKLYTDADYVEHLVHCEGSLELMRSGEILQLV